MTRGYERIVGKVHFAVDPKLAPNRIIADIDLGPRNAEGKVEFSADLYILRPRDPRRQRNRAGGNPEPRRQRHDRHVQPWRQFPARTRLHAGLGRLGIRRAAHARPASPRRAHRHRTTAKPIHGLVRSEWDGDQRVTTIPLGDRDELGYPVADAQDPANKIFVRDTVEGERRLIPRDQLDLLRSHARDHGRRIRARQDLRSDL